MTILDLRKVFYIIAILLSISVCAVHAQDQDFDKSNFDGVPKEVMRDVIRRILIYEFEPVSTPKQVLLAKQIYLSGPGSEGYIFTIEQSWLPEIKNVEFHLSEDHSDKDVYFFKELDPEKNIHQIGFAFGNPTCGYSGKQWKFRVSGKRSRLWQVSGGFGGGCSTGSGAASNAISFSLYEHKNRVAVDRI